MRLLRDPVERRGGGQQRPVGRVGPPPVELPAATVGRLLEMLSAQHEWLKRLLELAETKLGALRRADADALSRCAAEEQLVLQRLFEQEPERDAVLACVAQGLQRGDARRLRLAELAQQMSEPWGSRLRAKIAGLQGTARELRQKNRRAASVACNLHRHIRAVLDGLAGADQEPALYGPTGRRAQRSTLNWIDAVG